jgi:sporulation protein YlmC with PRC-barrel domain
VKMRTWSIVVLAAALGLPLALDASAQQRPADQPTPRQDQPRQTQPMERDREPRQAWQAPEGVFEANKIVGTRVRTSDGRDLGEIDQLLVNASDGKVSHVVIGRGGVAGIGETKVVVPWSQVTISRDRDGDRLVAMVDQSALAQAPRYEGKASQRERERPPAASPGTMPRTDRDRMPPGTQPQPR